MKPDWDKLMEKYADDSTRLIADVDCIGEGESLCGEVGVEGFPTIKYGNPDDLQDYDGGRDFEELDEFAKGLGPSCGPANLDLCDDDKKKEISKYQAMSEADLEKSIEEKQEELKKLESDFETFVEGLQKQYEDAQKKKDEGVKAVKNGGLGLMKAVRAHAKTVKSEL